MSSVLPEPVLLLFVTNRLYFRVNKHPKLYFSEFNSQNYNNIFCFQTIYIPIDIFPAIISILQIIGINLFRCIIYITVSPDPTVYYFIAKFIVRQILVN